MSNSKRPHGLQHARLPCPSLTPDPCSNSCPSIHLILSCPLHTLATWWEELTHWKDPDAGKDWSQEEKGTSLTWWTWIWASLRRWWWTGKPGLLQSMYCNKSDRTEQLNRTDGNNNINQWEVKLLCFSSFKEGILETAEGRRVSSVTETYLTSVTGRVYSCLSFLPARG